MKQKHFAAARRRFLEPIAEQIGVDYDDVSLVGYEGIKAPLTWGESEIGFGLFSVGADSLMARAYPGGFPAEGRFARKHSKLVTQSLGSIDSIEASRLLARSQAVSMAKREGLAGYPVDQAVNESAIELLDKHHPLPPGFVERMDHHVETSWEWAEELREREAAGEDTGEHAADAMADGRFHQHCLLDALECLFGESWREKSYSHLIQPDTSFDFLAYSMGEGEVRISFESYRAEILRAGYELDILIG